MSVIVAISVLCIAILGMELLLWMLFRRKMAGIDFPHEFDRSFFRFFTMLRMWIVIVLHALFLVLACAIILFWLW